MRHCDQRRHQSRPQEPPDVIRKRGSTEPARPFPSSRVQFFHVLWEPATPAFTMSTIRDELEYIDRILLKGFVHFFLYSPLEASVHHGRSLLGRMCHPDSQAVTSQPPPPLSSSPTPNRSRRVVFPSPLVRAREVVVVPYEVIMYERGKILYIIYRGARKKFPSPSFLAQIKVSYCVEWRDGRFRSL